MSEVERLRKEVVKKEQEIRLQEGLPHLHGWKWYPWALEFFLSTEKINLLCAANQASKSSTQIRKCIHWATAVEEWPTLWNQKPNQFWYLYPTQKQVDAEFETKWKLFLPQGQFETHERYGWKKLIKNKELVGIRFNTGVIVYFKTYAQDESALQTGSVFALFCDEELPVSLYGELIFRISATDGYFHMVFTATLGQEFWRLAMEPEEDEKAEGKETLPEAKKWTVSLYDCKTYVDGSNSHWTDERIEIIKRRCKDANEVLKRVFGRFILDKKGRKYPSFDVKRHMKPWHPVPKDWIVFGGADPGSGGEENHPAAICYVVVRPDFRAGRVYVGWRGDHIETTDDYVVKKAIEIKTEMNLKPVAQYYDWGSRDFFLIATGMGEPWQPAEKSHEIGEDVINTLFKNDMLFIYDTPELRKLATELTYLRKETKKNKAKDDLIDAMRYAITRIPWDFGFVNDLAPLHSKPESQPSMNHMEQQINERRSAMVDVPDDEATQSYEEEIAEFNELYGSD